MYSPDFWSEYLAIAREAYLSRRPVDAGDDPTLAATYEWLKKIDDALAKARSDGCTSFSCGLVGKNQRIRLRFLRPDGYGFQRTLRIDGRFVRRGKRISLSETVDLKVALQSWIVSHAGLKLRGALGYVEPQAHTHGIASTRHRGKIS